MTQLEKLEIKVEHLKRFYDRISEENVSLIRFFTLDELKGIISQLSEDPDTKFAKTQLEGVDYYIECARRENRISFHYKRHNLLDAIQRLIDRYKEVIYN